MMDFADAFNRGQQAAESASRARAEIGNVFIEASRQLQEVTGGELQIARLNFDKPIKRTMADMMMGSAATFLGQPKETEPWIAGRNPLAKDADWVQLARWNMGDDGYPCRISYGQVDASCHDAESLAQGIQQMLASSTIGEKLHEIICRELKPVDPPTPTPTPTPKA